MTTKEIFATNLRNLLYAKNKTQSELARGLNTSPTTVSHWVNGEMLPRSNMIDRICQYLSTTPDYIMTDHSKPATMLPQDIIAEEIENNPRLMRLFFYYMKLSDAELDKEIERISRK